MECVESIFNINQLTYDKQLVANGQFVHQCPKTLIFHVRDFAQAYIIQKKIFRLKNKLNGP